MKRASNRTNDKAARSSKKSESAEDGGEAAALIDHSAASSWQIVSDLPGRIRFRYARLRRDSELVRRVEAELACAHGVSDWHIQPLTCSVLIRFNAGAITKAQLTLLLERALEAPADLPVREQHPSPARFGVVSGSVVLAAAGELAVPALLPASAVLLVASNMTVIKLAWRELKQRHIGLPTLFSTIIVGTLASGQFLAASLMAWMMTFWRYRHRAAQFRLRRQLLPSLTQRPRFARLLASGQEVEVSTERLVPGNRIVVDEAEMVPADGRLVGEPAKVDERLIRGISGLSRKVPGDMIYAGSISLEGSIEIEVVAHGEATRAARIGRELAGAGNFLPTSLAVTDHGEEFGRRAVAPTLAAAGIGLIVGDITTASAILRPDYATGPGLGVSLETLQDIAACAREGIVIRDASALKHIASADVFLFDDLPALSDSGIKTTSILSLDGTYERDILQLAAMALTGLADARATALQAACELNKIELRAVEPSYRGPGITFNDSTRIICVRDARGQDSPSPNSLPLEVVIDGRLAGMVIFGPSPAPPSARAIADLRRRGLVIGLISQRADEKLATLAHAIGVDVHAGGLSQGAKLRLLQSLRSRGRRVAYIGDCSQAPEVAQAAHVAISVAGDSDPERDTSQVRVLRADLAWLAPLHELSRAHVDRVRIVHGATLVPNLACIAGAFFFGFTSMAAVVLTNLGTLAIYSGLPRRRKSAGAFSAAPAGNF
jgi:cation transport ATPase